MYCTTSRRHANLLGQIANNVHQTKEMEYFPVLTSSKIALSCLSRNVMCAVNVFWISKALSALPFLSAFPICILLYMFSSLKR